MNEVDQKKKMLLTGIIITVALFVIILIVLFILMGLDNKKTKIVYKNVTYKTKTTDISTEQGVYQQQTIEYNGKKMPIILIAPDKKVYYSIETITEMCGYKYNKGIYTETETLDESKNKCHIDNGGEYVSFVAGTNTVSKYIKVTDSYEEELKLISSNKKQENAGAKTEEEEIFTVEDNIIQFADEKLYAPYDAITKGLNMGISINQNIVSLYPLEELVNSYKTSLGNSGYSLTPNFRNQRGLYEGLAVVGKNEKYGVVKIDTNGYEEIISAKYDTVEYVQSIGEFIISSNNKFGMIKPGEELPTIELKYDNISLIDASKKIYAVQLNSKYGVVNSEGKEIIPTEYDQIGLDDITVYSDQGIKTKYIIANKCIPVVRNKLYGLYDLEGHCLVTTKYNSIGCKEPSKLISNTSAMPTLTVPLTDDIEAIVFSTKNAVGLISYGLVSTEGVVINNAYFTAIYYITTDGNRTYYFDRLNSVRYKLKEFISHSTQAQEFIKNRQQQSNEDYDKNAKEEAENFENSNSESSGGDDNDSNDEQNDEENNNESNEDNDDNEENNEE